MTMRKKICLLTVVEIYLDEFILEQEFVSVKYLLMDARSFQVQDMFQFVVEMKSMWILIRDMITLCVLFDSYIFLTVSKGTKGMAHDH